MLVADLDLDSAAQVAAECRTVATAANFRIESVHVDVSRQESVQEATDCMLRVFGRVDYSVNCAGVSASKTCPGARHVLN